MCCVWLASLGLIDIHHALWLDKLDVDNAKTPVNLVHQADVIAALETMISNSALSGVYNIVSAAHPSRQEFYQQACRAADRTPPTFNDNQETQIRIVNGDKYLTVGPAQQWPNLLDWLHSA